LKFKLPSGGGAEVGVKRFKLHVRPAVYGFFFLIGFLFVFFWKTEKALAKQGNILWTGRFTGGVLLSSLFLGILSGGTLCTLLALGMGRFDSRRGLRERPGAGRAFLISWALNAAAWLPAYLAYYPAVCAYDSPVQTGQAVENYFIDHHPIAHTLLVKWAMELGERVFHNVNTGVALYTLAQLLFLSGTLAFCTARLWKRGVRAVWLGAAQVFSMLYPFHMYMSVSMTKDTVFSGFFVLLTAALYEFADGRPGGKREAWREWLLFFGGVGVILFRTNGKYAYLALLGVLALMLLLGGKSRKRNLRLFIWAAAAFLAGNAALMGIFRAVGAGQGDKREMLSIPIQQMARCMIYHGGAGVLPEDDNTMDDGEKALVNDFILYEGYRQYNPLLADPVKSCTNTYVVRYRTAEFLQTYFRLLGRYPGDFINAFLAVNGGYLYPDDVSHAYVNVKEGQRGMGYVQTRWEEETLNSRGIYKASRWEALHEAMEEWADANAYLDVPVLRYLFVPGVWLWLYLILAGCLMIKGDYGGCMPLALVFGYFVTLLLGPAVQLRYIYPIMIVFPFAALFAMGGQREEETERIENDR